MNKFIFSFLIALPLFLMAEVPASNIERSKQLYEEGLRAFLSGKPDLAHKNFDEALLLNPDNDDAWRGLLRLEDPKVTLMANSNQGPLSVTIKLIKSIGNRYTFLCQAKNESSTTRSISVFPGCYFMHWVSNSPYVKIAPQRCSDKGLLVTRIKPLQNYERSIEVIIGDTFSKTKDFIQLGFSPYTVDGSTTTGPYWSNKIRFSPTAENEVFPEPIGNPK
jgi:hypothetical protein